MTQTIVNFTSRPLAYIFCNSKSTASSDRTQILGSIVRQLGQQAPKFDSAFMSLLDSPAFAQASMALGWKSVCNAAELLLSSFDEVFLLVDAIDECHEHKELAQYLATLVHRAAPQVKLLVLSRPEYPALETAFRNFHSIFIHSDINKDDIEKFTRSKLAKMYEDEELLVEDQSLRADIESNLIRNASGM